MIQVTQEEFIAALKEPESNPWTFRIHIQTNFTRTRNRQTKKMEDYRRPY